MDDREEHEIAPPQVLWSRTFACNHMSLAGLFLSASCGICGPMAMAA